MQVNLRRDHRHGTKAVCAISWQDSNGITQSLQGYGVDISSSGIRVKCPEEVPPGTVVYLEAHDGHPTGYCIVRHCTESDTMFLVGLEFEEETRKTVSLPSGNGTDYYEFLQISPNAEFTTIHRIYRFLASRFHPDNPDTGDPERFLLLKRAFEVLSDPERRAEYDRYRQEQVAQPIALFESIDFMDGVEGEVNRRLAVLSLLYNKRRSNPDNPRVTLADLEARMAFPREYLDFTTWYLKSKKYITIEDNSDFALTALGVDYVETNSPKIPILHKLLNSGSNTAGSGRREPYNRASGNEGPYILGAGEDFEDPISEKEE